MCLLTNLSIYSHRYSCLFIFIRIEELDMLDRGGQMWESGSTEKENKKGLVGDIFNVLKAFSGGAHITKNKYGET